MPSSTALRDGEGRHVGDILHTFIRNVKQNQQPLNLHILKGVLPRGLKLHKLKEQIKVAGELKCHFVTPSCSINSHTAHTIDSLNDVEACRKEVAVISAGVGQTWDSS